MSLVYTAGKWSRVHGADQSSWLPLWTGIPAEQMQTGTENYLWCEMWLNTQRTEQGTSHDQTRKQNTKSGTADKLSFSYPRETFKQGPGEEGFGREQQSSLSPKGLISKLPKLKPEPHKSQTEWVSWNMLLRNRSIEKWSWGWLMCGTQHPLTHSRRFPGQTLGDFQKC